MHNTFRKFRKCTVNKLKFIFNYLCCCLYFKKYKIKKLNNLQLNDMQTIISNELHFDSIDEFTENGKIQRNKTLLFNQMISPKQQKKQRYNKKNLMHDRNNNIQNSDSVSDAETFRG